MIEFYTHHLSPWAKQVHLMLEELELKYELKSIDLRRGVQHSKEYRDVGLFGRVPAIAFDGFCLSESGAILRYLAQKLNRFDLYPKNLEDRALTEQWFEFVNRHINKPLVDLAWNRHWAPQLGMHPDETLVHKSEKSLRRDFAVLDAFLQGRNFLVSSQKSLAEIAALPFLALYKEADWSLDSYPSAKEWYLRLKELPAWKRVCA